MFFYIFIYFLYMYLRIHLFCRRSDLFPGQHDVSLILKHLYIYFRSRLTFKTKTQKKEQRKVYWHYDKYLPKAWIYRFITKRIDHCDKNNKHYPLHGHIQWIVILSIRLFPESQLSIDSFFLKFEYPGSLKNYTMTCFILLFRFNVSYEIQTFRNQQDICVSFFF